MLINEKCEGIEFKFCLSKKIWQNAQFSVYIFLVQIGLEHSFFKMFLEYIEDNEQYHIYEL